jgi:hypothetical protein
LGHDEDLAADLGERAVHLALLVFEHPEMEHLLGQPVVLAEPIVLADAHEQEEARPDPGDELTSDRDRGSGDALE